MFISVPYLSSIYPSICLSIYPSTIYLPTSLSTYDLAIYQHVSNSLIWSPSGEKIVTDLGIGVGDESER